MPKIEFCECTGERVVYGDYDDFGMEFARCKECGKVVDGTIEYTDPNHPDLY